MFILNKYFFELLEKAINVIKNLFHSLIFKFVFVFLLFFLHICIILPNYYFSALFLFSYIFLSLILVILAEVFFIFMQYFWVNELSLNLYELF